MKRLIFELEGPSALPEVADTLAQDHLRGWRSQVIGPVQAQIDRSGLPGVSLVQRSAMLGFAWRGGFWGLALGFLMAILLLGLTVSIEPELRRIALYSLLSSFAFFGFWLGGLLGMGRLHPQIALVQPLLEQNRYVVFLDVADTDERLARKVMAICDARCVHAAKRRWGHYVFSMHSAAERGGLE